MFGRKIKQKVSNYHPVEAVSRYRDPQLQVGDNYSQVGENLNNITSQEKG